MLTTFLILKIEETFISAILEQNINFRNVHK